MASSTRTKKRSLHKKKALLATGRNATRLPKHAPRKARDQKLHIREKVDPKSETFCGGSHSEIWGRREGYKIQSVPPSQAKLATCGRCIRVAKSARRKLL
jgi:hypothetical protein